MDRQDYKLVRDKTDIKCSECCFKTKNNEDCKTPEELNCFTASDSLFYHWELKELR